MQSEHISMLAAFLLPQIPGHNLGDRCKAALQQAVKMQKEAEEICETEREKRREQL
jgi:hypothetical protein